MLGGSGGSSGPRTAITLGQSRRTCSIRTSRHQGPTRSGAPTSPTCGPAKAGWTSPSLSTCSHAGSLVDYQAELEKHGVLVSMSGKGNCYDNAMVETFFKALKSELVGRTVFYTRQQADRAIDRYIDGFYS